MFRSLRNRLIISHILPSLVIIPFMGITMLFLLENRILLPLIYSNLTDDATLIAEITHTLPDIWQNSVPAQIFVNGADPYLDGRLTLLDPYGQVIASSDLTDQVLPGQIVELPDLNKSEQGEVVALQKGPLAEIFIPVLDDNGNYMGVVRLSTRVLTVSDEIYQLRYLLVAVISITILAGILIGSTLALSINRPVQNVTKAIDALSQGDYETSLPETGIEETRILSRAVNTLVDRLHTMEQSRRKLLANLVHEVGRPLGALGSAIRALLKGADSDPELAKDLLNGMDEEINRLHRLLDDLTGLYDQALGSLELKKHPIDLEQWLPKVTLPWKIAAEEKGLHWKMSIPDGLPKLEADPDRLAQAIGNLCSNATKFTPRGGDISISTKVDGNQFWFLFHDSGIGIQKGDLEKIFLPFYRGNQEKRIRQGMGLGLTIVHDIVDAHGGQIQVESELGKGTTFKFWLPL
jgi:two-component system sensor histidine kinase BaeS